MKGVKVIQLKDDNSMFNIPKVKVKSREDFILLWEGALYIFIFFQFSRSGGDQGEKCASQHGNRNVSNFQKSTSLAGEYCHVIYIVKQNVKVLYLFRKSDNIDWVSLRNVCNWYHLGHNGKGDGSLQANHFDTSIVGMYHSPSLPCRLPCCRHFWTCSHQQCKQNRPPLVVLVWLVKTQRRKSIFYSNWKIACIVIAWLLFIISKRTHT